MEFTIDDVKTGMRAETRRRDNYLLIKSQNSEKIAIFDDTDLVNINRSYDEYFSVLLGTHENDIMKIFSAEGILLWERKEEIEMTMEEVNQALGKNVKIIEKH